MFPKILIANRGEIALRVIRACKEMGVSTVAVFSEADRDALHVSLADESICIGPAPAAKSYLNMASILSAAIITGAQAIHPGYGLLSENAEFSELCERCHIKFIGASAPVIRRMGDKDEARRTMREAGVPVIPGTDVINSAAEAVQAAQTIGFPLLIKARSGGGGRGIRRVDRLEDVESAFLTASAEAQSAFGDGAVYMEKLLENVKHIEVQVLCDAKGHCVCLGERECSMQRKNQKLVEESPSTAVDSALREKLYAATLRAVQAVGYEGVGTVEYLLTREGEFYFMEMNTRLQVEHPVTEMVTGFDLVKWQIRVAAGMELPFSQKDVVLRGHAIECRINAEDPTQGFRPCPGRVDFLHFPGGPGVRVDSCLYTGCELSPYYDSMAAKILAYAPTRMEAIRRMRRCLEAFTLEGFPTNAELSYQILYHPEFILGECTTAFLDEHLSELLEFSRKLSESGVDA